GRHRLPRWLRRPAAPLVHRPWGFQIADGGGAGHPQDIAFAPLAQLLAKPGMVPQLIVTRHPAVRHLRTPEVEHFQALLLSRAILDLLRHMTLLTSVCVPRPLFGQVQPEVEQGMIAARHISHVHSHLTVVDLPPVTTPLPLHPYRVGTPLGE